MDDLFRIAVLDDVPGAGLRHPHRLPHRARSPGPPRLLEIAHTLEELKTICRCGRKAIFNAPAGATDGSSSTATRSPSTASDVWYESLCGSCYLEVSGGRLGNSICRAASARGEDAELVALRVGEAHPWHIALADVGVSGAQGPQPGHLRRLIVPCVRPQVQMDAAPHGLHGGRAKELQIGPSPWPNAASHDRRSPRAGSSPSPRPRTGPWSAVRTVDHHRGDRPGVPVDRSRLQHANKLPSGSARTVHGTSPRPTSAPSHRAPTGARPTPFDATQRWWRGRGARGTSTSRGPDGDDVDATAAASGQRKPRFNIRHTGSLARNTPAERLRQNRRARVIPSLEIT